MLARCICVSQAPFSSYLGMTGVMFGLSIGQYVYIYIYKYLFLLTLSDRDTNSLFHIQTYLLSIIKSIIIYIFTKLDLLNMFVSLC